jgi:hypothetical protein
MTPVCFEIPLTKGPSFRVGEKTVRKFITHFEQVWKGFSLAISLVLGKKLRFPCRFAARGVSGRGWRIAEGLWKTAC